MKHLLPWFPGCHGGLTLWYPTVSGWKSIYLVDYPDCVQDRSAWENNSFIGEKNLNKANGGKGSSPPPIHSWNLLPWFPGCHGGWTLMVSYSIRMKNLLDIIDFVYYPDCVQDKSAWENNGSLVRGNLNKANGWKGSSPPPILSWNTFFLGFLVAMVAELSWYPTVSLWKSL